MASTNKTPLLHLSQWVETDKVKRVDFVEDNKKIEEAIKKAIKSITSDRGELTVTTIEGITQTLTVAPPIPEATEESTGTITISKIKELIKTIVPNATDTVKGLIEINTIKEIIKANTQKVEVDKINNDDFILYLSLGLNFENIELFPIYGNALNSRTVIELIQNTADRQKIYNNIELLKKTLDNEVLINIFIEYKEFLNSIFNNSTILNKIFTSNLGGKVLSNKKLTNYIYNNEEISKRLVNLMTPIKYIYNSHNEQYFTDFFNSKFIIEALHSNKTAFLLIENNEEAYNYLVNSKVAIEILNKYKETLIRNQTFEGLGILLEGNNTSNIFNSVDIIFNNGMKSTMMEHSKNKKAYLMGGLVKFLRAPLNGYYNYYPIKDNKGGIISTPSSLNIN